MVQTRPSACVPTQAPPLPGATDEEEPFLHSFLPAISISPTIVTAVLAMTQHVSSTLATVNRSATPLVGSRVQGLGFWVWGLARVHHPGHWQQMPATPLPGSAMLRPRSGH